MSLQADVAKARIELKRPQRCKVGDYVVKMTNDDREAFGYALQWVREGKKSQAWLVNLLNDNGYQVGKTVVRDHLREECACVASS